MRQDVDEEQPRIRRARRPRRVDERLVPQALRARADEAGRVGPPVRAMRSAATRNEGFRKAAPAITRTSAGSACTI